MVFVKFSTKGFQFVVFRKNAWPS